MACCHRFAFWRKRDFWRSDCTCHLLQRVFIRLVTPFPSPIVKGALAGRSPLICSRAVIIGLLRSQKDTQHVAEMESNSLPRERSSNSFASLIMISLVCHEVSVGIACCIYSQKVLVLKAVQYRSTVRYLNLPTKAHISEKIYSW